MVSELRWLRSSERLGLVPKAQDRHLPIATQAGLHLARSSDLQSGLGAPLLAV